MRWSEFDKRAWEIKTRAKFKLNQEQKRTRATILHEIENTKQFHFQLLFKSIKVIEAFQTIQKRLRDLNLMKNWVSN